MAALLSASACMFVLAAAAAAAVDEDHDHQDPESQVCRRTYAYVGGRAKDSERPTWKSGAHLAWG